jgi:hypothetical protein
MCSHISVPAGLLPALAIRNMFQYLSCVLCDDLITTEPCYALCVLGTSNKVLYHCGKYCY